MKNLFVKPTLLLICASLFSAVQAQNIYQLQPLAGFSNHGDGSLRPGDGAAFNLSSQALMDNQSNQRGMAYDPTQTNLIVVDTHTGAAVSDHGVGGIYVLNAQTAASRDDGFGGPVVLNTNGMPVLVQQTYPYGATAVAEDGAVYVANQTTGGFSNALMVYRWPSSTNTDPPYVCFSNSISPTLRWGTAMTIRGAGTNTQMLLGCFTGTNVVALTTVDGSNFTSTVLTTDVQVSSFDDGLAFGAGNTFWGKQVSQGFFSVLACFSFNLSTKVATTIKNFPPSSFPDNDYLGPIAVNTNLNLLVALELAGGQGTGGADRVRLYDISNFSNQPPALLDVKTFPVNNPNMTAPMGYINFKDTNIYVINGNNGIMAFGIGLAAPPAPTLTAVPAETNLAVVGRTVSLTVAGFPSVSYQWQSNSINIPNATNGTLTLVNVQNSYNQTLYNCVVTNASGATNASSRLVIVNPASFYHLNLQWSAYPSSTGTPDSPDHPYIFNGNGAGATAGTGTPNLRSFAYNPLSNHLYCITRSGFRADPSSSNYNVYVVDASTGVALYTMRTNDLSPGTNGIVLGVGNGGVGLASIAVADDGAIYACNVAVQAGGGSPYDNSKIFRLYRWADGNSNTPPVQIYTNDPAINGGRAGSTVINRWGDSMAVRGSGLNTQIILDNNNTAPARYVAFLTPADSTMTNWNTTSVVLQTVTGISIGRSLFFGAGAVGRSGTFWQKRNGTAVLQSPFDFDNPNDPAVPSKTSTAFTNALSGATIDATRNLLFGVSTYANATVTADSLDMYQITDLNSPLLLAQYNFPVNFGTNHFGNAANCINQTILYNDKIFTMDAGNGLMAFNIVPGAPTAPQFLIQPSNARVIQGGSVGFTVAVDQQAAFQWRFNGNNISGATGQSFSFTNVQLSNAGPYSVVASNLFGISTSAVATVTVVLPQDEYSLSPLWNIQPTNGNGNMITGNGGGSPNARTIAYNAASNHLYLVSRGGNSLSNFVVYILNASDGTILGGLNTNGLYNAGAVGEGGIGLGGIGVADDGAIYACNIALDACACGPNAGGTPADSLFRVYRWASEDTNSGPIQVFSGDPAGNVTATRWGDTLTVRGSGTNTEILLDTTSGQGAILRPTDQYLTNFTSSAFSISAQSGVIGRSLQFGSANTMWQKRQGTALRNSSYNTTNNTSATIASYANFVSTLGPVAQDFSRSLLAGIDFKGNATTPDSADLYDMTIPNTPLQIAQYNFPVNQLGNGNSIGQVVFAGSRVWALDGNNGLMGFNINGPKLTITQSGANTVVSWTTNLVGQILQATPSLSPPVTWTNVGGATIVGDHYYVTNSGSPSSLVYRLSK